MTARSAQLKEINTDSIRMELRKKDHQTAQELSVSTGLSFATVNGILAGLVAGGEAIIDSDVQSSGGRPAKLYSCNTRATEVLLVYFKDEKGRKASVHFDLVDLRGSSIDSKTVSEVDYLTYSPEDIAEMIEEGVALYPGIRAAMVGIGGNTKDGRVYDCKFPNLEGAEIAAFLSGRAGIDVFLENDANAAVLGYCRRNRVFDEEGVVYLYFPEHAGPGCGIYMGGRLHRGYLGAAGRFHDLRDIVDWDMHDGMSPDECIERVTRANRIVANLLDPERIVISAPVLTEEHLLELERRLSPYTIGGRTVRLVLTDDFIGDFREGLIVCALDRMEKRPYIGSRSVYA